MLMMINPRGVLSRERPAIVRRKKRMKRRASAAQLRNQKKFAAAARERASAARQARGVADVLSHSRRKGGSMAKKKSKRRARPRSRRGTATARKHTITTRGAVSVNPRGRRRRRGAVRVNRRRTRRNPMGTTARGLVSQVMGAAKDAGVIVLAKSLTNTVAKLIPMGDGNSVPMNAAKKVAAALAVSFATRKLTKSAKMGELALIGGLIGPIEDVIKAANVPVISKGLGSYVGRPTLGTYLDRPRIASARQAARPAPTMASLAGPFDEADGIYS